MMYGYGSGMSGVALFGGLMWLIVFIDLVLLGVWLWKQISRKQ